MAKDLSRIVIVSGDKGLRWSMGSALLGEGYAVEEAEDGAGAVEKVGVAHPQLVLVDFDPPGGEARECVRRIREANAEVLILQLASKESRDDASEAEKLGGCHTLEKPIDNVRLAGIVRDLLADTQIREEAKRLDPIIIGNRQTDRLILGRSRKMRDVYRIVERVSRSPRATVLIEGESGTGKEMIAKAIHHSTPECTGPFMEINCGSLPANLLESELFGHEQGAFTDAKHQKKGLIEMASRGTLFLDEIGEMPIELQAALLRVIETKRFKRVGGTVDIEVDLRITAATNQDLKTAIAEGRFRKDLFYRLNVVPIHIPPLRARVEDLPILASYFIDLFNRELSKNIRGLSPNARTRLQQYSWPGNIRELRNVIERAILLESEDLILLEHLPLEISAGMADMLDADDKDEEFVPITLSEAERRQILLTIEWARGNKTKAARTLGISRQTLREKLRQYEARKASS
ncbi:MAG: sigma-54-dependent Fis family transcriptional regulator [Candidatus Eisenbacteria bacterium]|nr:sigma-54-dependent Fis family transcriptional regulator [Candidatus Eisenbacteria bacterium]